MSERFTGVWIPAAVFLDKKLTFAERCLLGYMGSFKGRFFASNRHVAEMLGTRPQVVANMMVKLRKAGYLSDRTLNPNVKGGVNPNVIPLNPNVNIEQSIEQSIQKKKKAGCARAFSPENPEDLKTLLSLLAVRGIGENDSRREIDATLQEIGAGVIAPPAHWPAYIQGRVRKEGRKARVAAGKPAAVPVYQSQFSKTYN